MRQNKIFLQAKFGLWAGSLWPVSTWKSVLFPESSALLVPSCLCPGWSLCLECLRLKNWNVISSEKSINFAWWGQRRLLRGDNVSVLIPFFSRCSIYNLKLTLLSWSSQSGVTPLSGCSHLRPSPSPQRLCAASPQLRGLTGPWPH